MTQRKTSFFMIIAGFIGAVIGVFVGEALFTLLYDWPDSILMGLYFFQMAFFICGLFLLAEYLSPEVNSIDWKYSDSKRSFKYFIPSTLVIFFVSGFLFQLIYGFSIDQFKKPGDIYLAIDISESMTQTDPNRLSLQSATQFISELDEDKRVSITTFESNVVNVLPLTPMNQVGKNTAYDVINKIQYIGGTDIVGALNNVQDQIVRSGALSERRKPLVILLTDAEVEGSILDLQGLDRFFKSSDIIVNTIVVNQYQPLRNMLQDLAVETGGQYVTYKNVGEVTDVFSNIYKINSKYNLLSERVGKDADNAWYTALRLLFLMLIGLLFGVNLGIVFDNRFLATTYMIGGGFAGLLMGILIEWGVKSLIPDLVLRLISFVGLGLILALVTLVIGYRVTQKFNDQRNYRDRVPGMRGGHGF
jgi:Ca-activated chloride channel family protein